MQSYTNTKKKLFGKMRLTKECSRQKKKTKFKRSIECEACTWPNEDDGNKTHYRQLYVKGFFLLQTFQRTFC